VLRKQPQKNEFSENVLPYKKRTPSPTPMIFGYVTLANISKKMAEKNFQKIASECN
jgi:hypothetical protein